MDAKRASRGAAYRSAASSLGQSVTNAAGEVAVQMGAGTGVVGPGTLEVTGGTLAAETHRQNAGRNGVDPQTGQPYVMVPLSQFGLRWDEGRIGQWLAHQRPDLVDQARAVVAQHPGAADPA